jgi:hypothetical protein
VGVAEHEEKAKKMQKTRLQGTSSQERHLLFRPRSRAPGRAKEGTEPGRRTSTAPNVFENERFSLQTIPEVKDMLERVTNGTLNGEIDLGRARTAGYLASLILSCLKDYDLEKRMEAIEAKLELQK